MRNPLTAAVGSELTRFLDGIRMYRLALQRTSGNTTVRVTRATSALRHAHVHYDGVRTSESWSGLKAVQYFHLWSLALSQFVALHTHTTASPPRRYRYGASSFFLRTLHHKYCYRERIHLMVIKPKVVQELSQCEIHVSLVKCRATQ